MPPVPADAEQFGREVSRMYAQAELDTIKILSDELGSGSYTEGWAQNKLAQLEEVKGRVREEVIEELDPSDDVRKAIEKSYKAGSESMAADLKSAGIKNVKTEMTAINTKAVESIAKEVTDNLEGTHLRILRHADDVYYKAVKEAQFAVTTGTSSRLRASQKIMNKFANKGVHGFKGPQGWWNLSSYTEMATRASTNRAFVNGSIERARQNDRDLVIVSGHADSCAICAPWQGKILSISGKHPKYSSVDDAKSAGLWHPNCRHSLSPYVEGVTEQPEFERDEGLYQTQRIQRKNERKIRQWKRRKAAAMDDKASAKAQAKIREWQEKQRKLVDNNDVRRLYYREQVDQAH